MTAAHTKTVFVGDNGLSNNCNGPNMTLFTHVTSFTRKMMRNRSFYILQRTSLPTYMVVNGLDNGNNMLSIKLNVSMSKM